jgi:SNF family Na+-dependent transporter
MNAAGLKAGNEPEHGRNESHEERLDRKWGDILQELRVMQTGAQLTAGFLLTLPFQPSFDDLDSFQRWLYLALVLLAALTTALVMTPVAVHRRLSGQHVKERLVMTAHWSMWGVLTCISLLLVGMPVLIFDVVVDRSTALLVGGALGLLLVILLVVLPHTLIRDKD